MLLSVTSLQNTIALFALVNGYVPFLLVHTLVTYYVLGWFQSCSHIDLTVEFASVPLILHVLTFKTDQIGGLVKHYDFLFSYCWTSAL